MVELVVQVGGVLGSLAPQEELAVQVDRVLDNPASLEEMVARAGQGMRSTSLLEIPVLESTPHQEALAVQED